MCVQASNMVWRDLSAQQLENIRHPHPKEGLTGRDLLSQYVGITEAGWPRGAAALQAEPKNAINLDLYVHTLQFGQVRFVPAHSLHPDVF